MTEPESPWDYMADPQPRPKGEVKAVSRYPVIGQKQLERAIMEAVSDGAEMRDVKVVMTGAMQAGKIVAGPKGDSAALPMPILLVCWVKRTTSNHS